MTTKGNPQRWTAKKRARPLASFTLAPYVRDALRTAAAAQKITESALVERALLRELGLSSEHDEAHSSEPEER